MVVRGLKPPVAQCCDVFSRVLARQPHLVESARTENLKKQHPDISSARAGVYLHYTHLRCGPLLTPIVHCNDIKGPRTSIVADDVFQLVGCQPQLPAASREPGVRA